MDEHTWFLYQAVHEAERAIRQLADRADAVADEGGQAALERLAHSYPEGLPELGELRMTTAGWSADFEADRSRTVTKVWARLFCGDVIELDEAPASSCQGRDCPEHGLQQILSWQNVPYQEVSS